MKFLLAAALAMLSLSSSAASAQPGRVAGGDSLRSSDIEGVRLREAYGRFGECVVKRHRADARVFVLYPEMDDDARRKLVNKIADGDCLLQAAKSSSALQLRLPADTMRYTLADALVRAEFGSAPVADFSRVAPLKIPTLMEVRYLPAPGQKLSKTQLRQLQEARSTEQGRIFMIAYGECVVRTDPLGSHRLLATEVGSPEETGRFKALEGALGGCLGPARKLSMNKIVLRGTIASNYYRLATAARNTAATTGAQR